MDTGFLSPCWVLMESNPGRPAQTPVLLLAVLTLPFDSSLGVCWRLWFFSDVFKWKIPKAKFLPSESLKCYDAMQKPPAFFVFRYCSLLSKCWISRYSGFWVFRSAHFLQGIAVCFLLDSPIKNQYSTSCGERGASESFIHLNWSIVSLQCFVGFCWTIKWISYAYPYVPFLPLPHPTLLGHHRDPGWAPWAIQQLPTSSPFHTR